MMKFTYPADLFKKNRIKIDISNESLKILEEGRTLINSKISRLRLFCFLLGIIAVIMQFTIFWGKNNFIYIAFMSIMIIYGFIESKITKNIKAKFKDEVVHKIIKSINPNFIYQKDSHIAKDEIKTAGIFEIADGDFSGNDLISGEIDGVKFKMSDICYKEKRSNFAGKIEIVTIFQGIVFVADFYKNFSSKTAVVSSSNAKPNGKKIKLDHVLFNENFRIYTDDEIGAFYILSPKFIEHIMKLRNKFYNVDMSFIDSKIYIFIGNNEDNFEINLDISFLNIKEIFAVYTSSLNSFFSLVNDLKLDNKIFKIH